MDYAALFDALFPGFFAREGVRGLPEGESSIEMVLPLDRPLCPAPPCGQGCRFDWYTGDPAPLHRAVAQVEADWVQYFDLKSPVLCAFAGDEPVSFCIVDTFGEAGGVKVGGPGCVGTVPTARRQGVGLRLVWEATRILQERGYGLSWIHYTYLDKWYGRLGYETVLRWDRNGLLPGLELGAIVWGVTDIPRAIRFWCAALDYEVKGTAAEDFAMLAPKSGRTGVQLSLNRVSSPHARRHHMDLFADDQKAEAERLIALGATRKAWRYEPDADYVVLNDPDGNPFCVVQK